MLSDNIIQFFEKQSFVIVSTVDERGRPHSACKGIVEIGKDGKIYLLDLYRERTFKNLNRNPAISITAVDEHHFSGYCLKGKARLVRKEELGPKIMEAWEEKITRRITHRLLRNVGGERGHPLHPEAHLPKPEYMLLMEVDEIVELTPRPLKSQ